MYEAFFGLRERPFDLTPNPRFLCMTASHREALSTIQYGIAARKGLTLLVGPSGSGKTTLVRAALEQQQGANIQVVCLNNPLMSREEFFDFLTDEFQVPCGHAASKSRFIAALQSTLEARHAAGLVTALIIDEAQTLSDALLEEVRLLENLETTTEKLLPMVLVAHTEFSERIRQPALLPIRQRIALRSSLSAMTPQDTSTYISERVRIAGGDVRQLFTPEAVAAICESSGGIPRTVSVICDNALVGGFALDQRPVGAAMVHEVCRDFDLPLPRRAGTPSAFVAPPALAASPHFPSPAPAAAARGAATLMAPEPPAARATLRTMTEPVFALPAVMSAGPGVGELGLTVRSAAFTTQGDLAEMAETTMSHLTMPTVAGLETLVIDPPPEPPSSRPRLSDRMRTLRSRIMRTSHK